jgi:hypothetical protein
MKNIAASWLCLALIVCCCGTPAASAQALPAGGSLQDKWEVGVAGSLVNPGYVNTAIGGGMVYWTYNPIRVAGIEARAHYAYDSTGEREFSLTGGYRFNLPMRGIVPYAGGLIGFGHFDYDHPVTGSGSNSFVISYLAGVEVPAGRHLNLRLIEVEAQVWTDFPPNGLSHVVYSAGVAYHR